MTEPDDGYPSKRYWEPMAVFFSIAALVVSLVSVLFSYRAIRVAGRLADAAARSADAAESSDRRARAVCSASVRLIPSPPPGRKPGTEFL
jgi:hypothetical protein